MGERGDFDIMVGFAFILSQNKKALAEIIKGARGDDKAWLKVAEALLKHLRRAGFDVVRVRPLPKAPSTSFGPAQDWPPKDPKSD